MGKKEEKQKKSVIDTLGNNNTNQEIEKHKKEEKKHKKEEKKKEKKSNIKLEKKIKSVDTNKSKNDVLTTISDFLCSIKAKHLPDVLLDLMTEKEIQEFAERIEILKQLEKGVTQRVIAKNLGISVTTVSRGSKVLQTGKQKIKKYL